MNYHPDNDMTEDEHAHWEAKAEEAGKGLGASTCSVWTRSRPTHEGLWAWKSSVNVKDMGKWRVFFVEDEMPSLGTSDEGDTMTYWECQTDTRPPMGGWWRFILPNSQDIPPKGSE